MDDLKNVYFSPGIFFSLITQVKRVLGEQKSPFTSEAKTYTDVEAFKDLIYVVLGQEPIIKGTTFKKNVSQYKNCSYIGGKHIPFNNDAVVSTFDNEVKTNYDAVLKRMTTFAEKHINKNMRSWLVKLTLDLLAADKNTCASDVLYVNANGSPSAKDEVIRGNNFVFQSFLLGILHFTLVNRNNNLLGAETYESLFCREADYTRRRMQNFSVDVEGMEVEDISDVADELVETEVTKKPAPISKSTAVNLIRLNKHTPNTVYTSFIVGCNIDICEDMPSVGRFLFPKDRVLNSNMMPELMEEYKTLDSATVEKLKKYPAIFANENKFYGKADDDQFVAIGYITDIVVQENGVKIYYTVCHTCKQQLLNELGFETGVVEKGRFNLLNRTHWVLKKIDIVEVLEDNGVDVFLM